MAQRANPDEGVGGIGATARFDVVALVASAGGLEALSVVLRELPQDFPAAVVVGQHVGGQGSGLVRILQRRVGLPVEWAADGRRIQPGRVTVCRLLSQVEVLPNGVFSVRPGDSLARGGAFDSLLTSIGDSYGERALGVVLTGMGRDGAAGTVALRAAGGVVIAQDEDTAEHSSMPRAAAAAGADLVLPLREIGRAIVGLTAGGDLPGPRSEQAAAEELFRGPGEARAILRQIDWSATPLGPVTEWPVALRTVVRTVLATDFPMFLMWGPQLVQIGNDAYAPTLGDKRMQGLPVRTTWAELWDFVGPRFDAVRQTGQPIFGRDVEFSPNRHGFVEEAYFTYCYSALRDEGEIAGILETSLETTARVLADRRLATLRALATSGVGAEAVSLACERAARTLAKNPRDIPFALLYLTDSVMGTANLRGSTGVQPGSSVAPHTLSASHGTSAWPISRVLAEGEPLVVDDLPARFAAFHAGPWPEPPRAAVLLPIRPVTDEPPLGVLIAGFSPRLLVDDAYRGFLELVGAQISAGVAEAGARHRERERIERLAELDRLKTEFLSNVSHEFRTPLTLMLGPLDDLLAAGGLDPGQHAELEPVRRNARQLLRLVGTLLDFSQIEAGRLRARFVPVELAERTREIVAQFESAIARAGLELHVELEQVHRPVWVDVQMWEKIVSNLLSNALKFTFEGEIEVTLRVLSRHAQLVIRDTGVGIPPEDLPHIFKRFHRVQDARARTHEGAGIGLALVDELVRRHHGRIRATSTLGRGTTQTVWIPLERRPAGEDPVGEPVPPDTVAAALAEEAMHWGPDPVREALPRADSVARQQSAGSGARVLIADDNQDMRDYLVRLLSPHWVVERAGDGKEALDLARRTRPDLVLADVMMPGLDGLELLSELRSDSVLHAVPVVLLTGRAGEEAAIDGLLSGADDYMVKPFSARELVARVGGQLELAGLRKHAAELTAFPAALSDALRPLADTAQIKRTAARMLGRTLDVNRAFYAEIEGTDWLVSESFEQDVERLADGRHETAPFGPWILDTLHSGASLVFSDLDRDARFDAAQRQAHAAYSIAASIAVPLVKKGELVAILVVHSATSRQWREQEIAVVTESAERTWAAIERAHAEAGVRATERRYRELLESIDQGFCSIEIVRDERQEPIDGRYLAANPAYERVTGHTDVVGRLIGDVDPERLAEWLRICREAAQTDRPTTFRLAVAGAQDPLEVRAWPLSDADSPQIAILLPPAPPPTR